MYWSDQAFSRDGVVGNEEKMTRNMERGARIVIEEWMRVKRWDKLLLVTTKEL